MVDVMLPRIDGVVRLSEGIMLARWIQDGRMPDTVAQHVRIPEEMRCLKHRYADVPIYFVTGRSREKIELEIAALSLTGCQVIEKGAGGGMSAADHAIAAIRQASTGFGAE